MRRTCGPENPDPKCPDCQYALEKKAALEEVARSFAAIPKDERERILPLARRFGLTIEELLDLIPEY